MQALRTFLAGKKLYLTAIAGILAALIAYGNGTLDTLQLVEAIWLAVMGITGRAAIGKIGKK